MIEYTLMSGAGNVFAVVDLFRDSAPEDPAELARAICAAGAGVVPRPDGLLLARPPRSGGDCAMELYNADGSRPETCGNGLRCVAKLVHDRGHVRGERFTIEDDAGPHATEVEVADDRGVVRARIAMGTPRIVARAERIDALGAARTATLVDVGNPHCVLFVDDERTAPVATLGPALERDARFPRGTNVEFLALRREGAFLRVWERGVGETQACGSGACAAAAAAVAHGLARFPVALRVPGGVLEVDDDGAGGVVLTGPVEVLTTGRFPRDDAARARTETPGAAARRRG